MTHTQPTAIAVYTVVAVTLLGGIGLSLGTIGAAVKSAPSVQSKTPLQVQVESAREIRKALARSIPAPDPLPPITAKVDKPVPKIAARPAPQRNPEYAMRQARQAFAEVGPPPPPSQSFLGFLAFDRHAMR